MKFRLKRVNYYFVSMITLLRNVFPEKWLRILFNKEVYLIRTGLVLGFVSFRDLLVIKEVIIDRDYEQEGVAVSSGDKAIVDVGAGIGDFVISLARQHPKSILYAFEPNQAYFSVLQKNISRNNIKNIFPYKIAVNSLKEILSLTHTTIDILKIDCEGCEFSILSSKSVWDLKKVKKITMEYHLLFGKLEKLTNVLGKVGFEVVLRRQKDIPEIGYLYAVKK